MVVPASAFEVTKAETNQSYPQVILNLLDGQQYFGVPHVYQGGNGGAPTSQWPAHYGPNNASQYLSPVSTSVNQPVLVLAPAQPLAWGATLWQEYRSGGSLRITNIGTYASGTSPVADGFAMYLFLPSSSLTWGISPTYNYSINYASTAEWNINHPSPVEGEVILPQSKFNLHRSRVWPIPADRLCRCQCHWRWNAFVVTNPNGNNAIVTPSPSLNLGQGNAGWDGIGTGKFQLEPVDWLSATVSYNPSVNALTGIAHGLNAGQSVSFTLNPGGHSAPSSCGSYGFGIGPATGGDHAHWALSRAATTQQAPTPPSPAPPLPSARRRTRSGNSGAWKLTRIDMDSLGR